jgi:hypothetical protein
MVVVYIAGAYRAKTLRGIVENIRKAEEVAIKYWKRGYAVICPHLNSALLDGEVTDQMFLNGDLAIISRCDIVVMMKDWQASKGATAEHNPAKDLGIQIIYEGDL